MRGFWFCLCATLASIAIAAPAAPPAGSRETEFLRAARNGDFRNVFGVSLFGGIVTLPRTLTLVPSDSFRARFGTSGEGSTLQSGTIYIGKVMEQQRGRIDADSKIPLPRGPKSVEKIGPLTLEHYDTSDFIQKPSIFITDGHEYAWFAGGATILAKEVARVFASKDGPNHDYFVAAPTYCFDSVIAADFAYDSHGHILMLRSAPPAGAASFAALGFKPGDKIRFESYAKAGESERDTFERVLKTPTPDGVRVPIERSGKQVVVPTSTATMARELPKCAPQTKSP